MVSVRKAWYGTTVCLLFALAFNFMLNGMFLQKHSLTNNTPPQDNPKHNKRKVVMLLVDALREDFVEFDDSSKHLIDMEASTFKGQRIQIFKELMEKEPKNTVLVPMASEMPTITTVRIKSVLSGTLSPFIDTGEQFAEEAITEDNVLYQLKNKKTANGQQPTIVFAGDHIWMPMFQQYFDRTYVYSSENVRDMDTLDEGTTKDVVEELKNGSDFTLMLAHILGIDHAGHTFNAQHQEIERKVKDTDGYLRQIIDNLDEDTTLLVYGDHGMTEDGNHGGGSSNEIRSVLFGYNKGGIPMQNIYSKYRDEFEEIDMSVKQSDLAAIVSMILDLPLPFSNLGMVHPVFYPGKDLQSVHSQFLKNLEQFETYINTYCKENQMEWCEEQIKDFNTNLKQFRKSRPTQNNNLDYIAALTRMHRFSNEKYQLFAQTWTQFDDVSIISGIFFAFSLLMFHIVVGLNWGQPIGTTYDSNMMIGTAVSVAGFLSGLLGIVPMGVVGVLVISISLFLIRPYVSNMFLSIRTRLTGENIRPKIFVHDCLTLLIIVIFTIQQEVDSFIQEADYFIDGILLLILGFLWMTQPVFLRSKDAPYCLVIIACIKIAFFLDRERSLNFETEEILVSYRDFLYSLPMIVTFGPFLCIFVLETKINLTKNLGLLNTGMNFILTGSLFLYKVFSAEIDDTGIEGRTSVHQQQRVQFAQAIYLCIILFIALTFTSDLCSEVPREHTSIKIGLFLLKAAIHVSSHTGPLLYFLMLLQLYCFSKVLSQRRASMPRLSFPLHCFFVYFTMMQYFYRGNHRERFDSIQFGKVCPGNSFCGVELHWVLMLFELFASHLVSYLIMPLIINTNVNQLYNNYKEIQKYQEKPTEELTDKDLRKTYRGQMSHASGILLMMTYILLFASCFFAWWSKQEIIFPQRSAPKLVFDLIQAAMMTVVGLFWAHLH